MDENEVIDVSNEVKENNNKEDIKEEINQEKKKDNKSSTFKKALSVLLIICLSFVSGYVGGTLGKKETKVVYEKVPLSSNNVKSKDDLTIQEVVDKVKNSVVMINSETVVTGFLGQSMKSESAGSGVIIDKEGYIVTNNHVIDRSNDIYVTLLNGEKLEAELIGTDAKTDLAVIKVDAGNYDVAEFGDSDNILVGDTAIAIGNPLGVFGGTVTSGIISALNRDLVIENQAMNLLQTNAEISPGNSGGGLFNSKAELIGIVNAKTIGNNADGIGFAIPINDVKDIVNQLITNGYVSNRATLGIYTSEVGYNNQGYTPGLYVSDVIEGSGAYKAGMKQGDRIISINDIEINSYPELSKELKNYSPNETVKIVVIRDGKQIDLKVTLTEAIIQKDNN